MIHNSLIIVGGGPVGLTLALSLANCGHKVTVIDSGIDKSGDGRVLALSYASQQLLVGVNGWPANVTPINCVEVSHAGLGISQIKASALELDSLGYTVGYHTLCSQLLAQVQQNININLLIAEVKQIHDGGSYVTIDIQHGSDTEIITADWVFLAEGGSLLAGDNLRINHDYRQQALVAHIKTLKKHGNIAYERFGSSGPLVLLPYEDHYVIVWSLDNELAKTYLSNNELFITELNRLFVRQLGGCSLLSKIHSFPLFLKQVRNRVLQRIVLLGNSAQLLHPISAQGLNVGLRDVKTLAKLFRDYSASKNFLDQYHQLRESDVGKVVKFTHLLATKMESQNRVIQHLRGVGLAGLNMAPRIQNTLAYHLIYGF